LTIFDGPSIKSPKIGKYCGSSLPPSFVSSGSEIFIHFKTDSDFNGPGFKLEYTSKSE